MQGLPVVLRFQVYMIGNEGKSLGCKAEQLTFLGRQWGRSLLPFSLVSILPEIRFDVSLHTGCRPVNAEMPFTEDICLEVEQLLHGFFPL